MFMDGGGVRRFSTAALVLGMCAAVLGPAQAQDQHTPVASVEVVGSEGSSFVLVSWSGGCSVRVGDSALFRL